MDTISELFNGNIRPFENMHMSQKYYNTSEEIVKTLNELEESLPQTDIADKIRSLYAACEDETAEIAFRRGFALGVRLTAACYEKGYEEL